VIATKLTDPAKRTSTSLTVDYLSISIIVPVRNEGRHIEATLRQLLDQEYSGEWEILVVDGESTDDTAARVKQISAKNPRVRLLSNPKRLSSAARNIGIEHARGEVLLVVDGHCEISDRKLLENVSVAFVRSGAACLGRPQPLNISNATPMQRAIALARSSRLGHHPDSFIYAGEEHFVPAHSVAVAYRREVFEKVGRFDERFDACEDVELNHRIDKAGLKCFFTPSIQVRYFPRASLAGLFKQLVRYGRGRMRLLKKHPDTFSLGSFLPAIFWIGVLFGWLGGFLWPPLWLFYFGVLGLYAGAVILISLQIALSHQQIRLLSFLPVIFVTIHLASATGVLRELPAVIHFRRNIASESS
jgi:succinoglycan biosynthesis protein ExoA